MKNALRTRQYNFRLDAKSAALLREMADKIGVSQVHVIRRAIHLAAKKILKSHPDIVDAA